MLDIRLIREDPDRVKRAMKTRNKDMDAVVDEIIAIDQKRRELASKRDGLKAEQNNASKLIPQIKKSGGDISEIMQKMNKVKEAIKADEDELNALEQKPAIAKKQLCSSFNLTEEQLAAYCSDTPPEGVNYN